jgi:Na+/H+ antiporter NhaD/arsenite permease-like protein
MTTKQLVLRGILMVIMAVAAGFIASVSGLDTIAQILAVSVFVLIISATIFFWHFRLAIAFLGISVLLGGRIVTLEQMLVSTELDIILFLVGMMTMVGVLKDLGLFTWIIQAIINFRQVNGIRFVIILILLSALMACVVDEVTSIVFILALVFQVCDTLKIKPLPFVIIAVLSTNIGSSGTMLGNPVGILIGTRAGFSFQDFIVYSFPIMLVSIAVTLGILLYIYRKEITVLGERLEMRRQMQLGLGPLVKIPVKRSFLVLVGAITLIALHHVIETIFHIDKNTVLIIAPLAISGVLMIWRNQRARHYIEAEVEWWTLLFFMMLFAVAGGLEHTGVTSHIAGQFTRVFGSSPTLLTPVVIVLAALGSAFVDNIVFVAAFIPVVKELHSTQLWWALLFGACFGGNITVIGSTANIVALGMLEKRYRSQIKFLEWLKIGSIIGIITCLIAWGAILLMAPLMPIAP